MNNPFKGLKPSTKTLLSVGALVLLIILGVFIYWQGGNIWYISHFGNSKNQPENATVLKQNFTNVFRHPNNAQFRLSLGSELIVAKDLKDASKQLNKALELDVNNIGIYQTVVNTYSLLGEYSAAEKYALQAVDKFPKNPQAYVILSDLYGAHFSEKFNDLAAIYDRGYENTKSALFLLLGATNAVQRGDTQKAISYYTQWLADPANTANRVQVELQLKQLQAAK